MFVGARRLEQVPGVHHRLPCGGGEAMHGAGWMRLGARLHRCRHRASSCWPAPWEVAWAAHQAEGQQAVAGIRHSGHQPLYIRTTEISLKRADQLRVNAS